MLTNIKTKGFTMLEVLVAIFVVTIGVLAVFNMVQNITVSFRANASQLTAAYLAQEGVELVRNERDNNWLQGSAWDNIDMLSIGCATSGVFGKFNRACAFSTSTNGTTTWMNVSSTVSWQERGSSHSVTNATELYKWLYP
jgi:type IV pilus modification protein PilV